jgi:hypothetical protein
MDRKKSTRKNKSILSGQELIAYRQAWSINSLNGVWPSKPKWSDNLSYTVVNGYTYLVRQFDKGKSYFIGGQERRAECALLLVSEEEGLPVGILQGIRKGRDCITPPGENPTGNMLIAAWRLCYKLGLHHMEISDIAKIHCNDKEMFVLSDMELLTKGVSWYEKFLPLFAEQKPIGDRDKFTKKISWDECKRRALTNTWGYVKSQLGPGRIELLRPLIESFSDDTLAKEVFTNLKNLEDSCVIFATYLQSFIDASNVNTSSEYIWKTIPIMTRDPPPIEL